jgi:hypothetical protein
MFRLNLFLNQIAQLELQDIIYVMHDRNADGVTFSVEFPNEREFARALEILIRR